MNVRTIGGRTARISDRYEKKLRSLRRKWSPVGHYLALRDHNGKQCVEFMSYGGCRATFPVLKNN